MDFVCLSSSDGSSSVWLSFRLFFECCFFNGDSFLARFFIIIDDVVEVGEIEFVECFRLIAERADVILFNSSFRWISDRRISRGDGVLGSIVNGFLLDEFRFNKGVLVWGLKNIIEYFWKIKNNFILWW